MVGLPIVTNYVYYLTVYLVPLGLLILIILLNRNYEVCTKPKVFFYSIEILLVGLTIGFILASDTLRNYILLVTISLSCVVVVGELIYVYYGGIDFSRSAKVFP